MGLYPRALQRSGERAQGRRVRVQGSDASAGLHHGSGLLVLRVRSRPLPWRLRPCHCRDLCVKQHGQVDVREAVHVQQEWRPEVHRAWRAHLQVPAPPLRQQRPRRQPSQREVRPRPRHPQEQRWHVSDNLTFNYSLITSGLIHW